MKLNTVFTAILFAIALMFVLFSFQYRYEARIAPLLVGIVTTICLAVVLVNNIMAMYKARRAEVHGAQEVASVDSQPGVGDYLQAVAWVVGLVIGIYLVGLVIALPLFVLVYLRVYKESWLSSLVTSACIFLVIWGFFDRILHVSLYWGILLE